MWETYLIFRKFITKIYQNISGTVEISLEGSWNNPIVFFGTNVLYSAKYLRRYSLNSQFSNGKYTVTTNYNSTNISETPIYDTGLLSDQAKGKTFTYTAKSNLVAYSIYYFALKSSTSQLCDVQIKHNNTTFATLSTALQTGWDTAKRQLYQGYYRTQCSYFGTMICNIGDVATISIINGTTCDIWIKFYDITEEQIVPVDVNAFIVEDSKIVS